LVIAPLFLGALGNFFAWLSEDISPRKEEGWCLSQTSRSSGRASQVALGSGNRKVHQVPAFLVLLSTLGSCSPPASCGSLHAAKLFPQSRAARAGRGAGAGSGPPGGSPGVGAGCTSPKHSGAPGILR